MIAKGSLLLFLIVLFIAAGLYQLAELDGRIPPPVHAPLSKPIEPAVTTPPTAITPQPPPVQPNAARLLSKALSMSAAERTFHFVMDRQVPGMDDDQEIALRISVTGQYHAPDSLEGTIVLFSSSENSTVDFIVIGDSLYLRDHPDGVWQQPDSGSLIAQTLFENAVLPLAQFSAEELSSPVLVGESLLHGLPVYHVRSLVLRDADEVEQRMGAGTKNFWISKEDHCIYRIKSEMKVAGDDLLPGGGVSTIQIDYAAYGTPVLIAKPLLVKAKDFDPPEGVLGDIGHEDSPGLPGATSAPLRVVDRDLPQEQ